MRVSRKFTVDALLTKVAKRPITLPAVAAATGISGSVSSAGAVESGSGFTVERTATGVYKVTPVVELPAEGVILVTSQFALSWRASGPSKTTFTVEMFSASVVAEDSGFNFEIGVA